MVDVERMNNQNFIMGYSFVLGSVQEQFTHDKQIGLTVSFNDLLFGDSIRIAQYLGDALGINVSSFDFRFIGDWRQKTWETLNEFGKT